MILFCLASSRDPIARKLRLRRSKRDHEEEKQAKILKVHNTIKYYLINNIIFKIIIFLYVIIHK